MIGSVVVMEPSEYQAWLERRQRGGLAGRRRRASCSRSSPASPATAPTRRAAARCWTTCSARRSSSQGGAKVIADEAYIRESILNPQAKVVAGFQPIMPTFQGQVSEEQLLQLIAYIKSLEPAAARSPRRQAHELPANTAAQGDAGTSYGNARTT